jgi:hypothetical protein
MAIAMRMLDVGLLLDTRSLPQPRLGQKLSELRNRYRWSQNALAEQAGLAVPPTRD